MFLLAQSAHNILHHGSHPGHVLPHPFVVKCLVGEAGEGILNYLHIPISVQGGRQKKHRRLK